MLTPILAVKTVTPSAAPASQAGVEAKGNVQQKPAISSGQQRSEAALRILETLNRQLIGAETLPKEALVRLLDTLSRLLKVQPLPQESLRDFGKRIAVAIEALPPAERLALEKQLGQRNLALSVRVLAEIVKALPIPEAPHTAPQQSRPVMDSGQSNSARGQAQVATQPLQILPRQAAAEGRPLPLPLSQPQITGQAFTGARADAGVLQAVLRSVFAVDDTVSSAESTFGEVEQEGGEPPSQTAETRIARPASSSPASFAGARGDSNPIPALHAVARFLAENPEALAQVVAIISGDIDENTLKAIQQALTTDTALETALPLDERQILTPSFDAPDMAASGMDADDITENVAESLPQAVSSEASEPEYTIFEAAQSETSDETNSRETLMRMEHAEEPQAEEKIDKSSERPRIEGPLSERAARTIADALKTLIEVGLPLSSDGLNEPLEQLLTNMALQDVESDAVPRADGKTLPTNAQPAHEPGSDEPSSAAEMLEESKTVEHDATAIAKRQATAEELQREGLSQKLPEAIFLREGLPFLAMPIASKAAFTASADEADEDRRFTHDDDQEQPSGDQSSGDQASEDNASKDSERVDPANEESDASGADSESYALYRRLGGLN